MLYGVYEFVELCAKRNVLYVNRHARRERDENVTRTGTGTLEKSAKGRKKERSVTHFLAVPFLQSVTF